MKTSGEMTIHQCERLAKEVGFDSMEFDAKFPAGVKRCKWLDAHYGMFLIPEIGDGFFMVRMMEDEFPDLICIPLEKEPS